MGDDSYVKKEFQRAEMAHFEETPAICEEGIVLEGAPRMFGRCYIGAATAHSVMVRRQLQTEITF